LKKYLHGLHTPVLGFELPARRADVPAQRAPEGSGNAVFLQYTQEDLRLLVSGGFKRARFVYGD
jgi:hypothetical protein